MCTHRERGRVHTGSVVEQNKHHMFDLWKIGYSTEKQPGVGGYWSLFPDLSPTSKTDLKGGLKQKSHDVFFQNIQRLLLHFTCNVVGAVAKMTVSFILNVQPVCNLQDHDGDEYRCFSLFAGFLPRRLSCKNKLKQTYWCRSGTGAAWCWHLFWHPVGFFTYI